MTLISNLEEAKDAIVKRMGKLSPKIGIILGSGLGPLADRISDPLKVPFKEIPHMQSSTATGHIGQFVMGDLGGKEVICMQGRLHGYEGYSAHEVAFPVWLMHELGVNTLITTNAAGAINENFNVGDFCIMTDHINFTGRNPVAGIEPDQISPRFFSMYDAYDPHLREMAREVAIENEIPIQEGIYLGLLGPSFETPAEIRTFRQWGADTVAMSVCEEVIAARHVGMKVLGISLCSNMACGVGGETIEDDKIFEIARSREPMFCTLIEKTVERI